QSRLLAALSAQGLGVGNAVSGMLLGLEALPDVKYARPYLPEAEEALFNAFNNRKERVVQGGVESLSPDGKHVLTTSDTSARIWDMETNSEVAILKVDPRIIELANFSPDGRRVAAAAKDGTVWIWETETGSERRVLKIPDLEISDPRAINFSPDGARVTILCKGQTVRIWDIDANRELTVLQGPIRVPIFSPNGSRVASPGPSANAASVWDAS